MGFDSPLHYKKKNKIICAHGAGPRRKTRIKSKIKKIMKKILTSAIAILAMVGCTSEDFVGDKELQRQNEDGAPISFNLVSAPPTRALQTGSTAATALNNNFVVYGWKTKGGTTPETQVVFNNYQANYVDGSAATTTSNSAGWEYVGYTNVPGGVTANVGVTAFATSSDNATGVDQSIKYWDYSASKYEFFGYSLGKGVTSGTPATTTYATATALSHTTPVSYTLSGSQAELAACYISDLLTKTDMSATNTQVQLQFRKMESKVRIALYETIPGYSVKDVKFYASGDNSETPTTTAYLYAGSSTLPAGGTNTYTVTFDTNGKPQVTVGSGGGTSANLSFGVADATNPSNTNTWDNWAHRDYKEVSDADVTANANADTLFIGRASNEATISESQLVLPNPTGTVLTLKVDYTLVSRDGYGETIEVKGATATVPAAYAQWQPNCSYTYLFKITDENLDPITLDAAVITDASGKQETITTITDPSITTYQKGSDYATTDEYKAGTVYVTVANGTALTVTGDGINARLYTVTNVAGSGAAATPSQGITETTVANALTQSVDASGNYVVTDANGWTMTVSPVTSGLTAVTEIDAADSPTGKAITVNGAKFTATAGTTYVFEYKYKDAGDNEQVLYKVIKVASGS